MPAPRWPLITQRGPRNIPVVGPIEALRAPAGRPGADTPPVAAAVPASQRRESGWQLAQRAWRDSGRDWENAPGRPPVPGPRHPDAYDRGDYGSGPYAPDPDGADGADAYASASYGPGAQLADASPSDPYAPGAYHAGGHRPGPYAAPRASGSPAYPRAAGSYPAPRAHGSLAAPRANGSYAATPYAPDVFAPDPYALDPYAADEHAPSAYAPAPHGPEAYPADRGGAGTGDAEPYRPGSRPSRFEREDSDATRVDFGMPHRPRPASPGRQQADPPAPRFYPADPGAGAPAGEGLDASGALGPAAVSREARGYSGGVSASGFHPADRHAGDARPGDGYVGNAHADDAHSGDPRPGDACADDGYADANVGNAYADNAYADNAHAGDAYADAHAGNAYADAHAGNAYAGDAQAGNAYADDGYADAHAGDAYADAYAGDAYAGDAHAGDAYADSAYADDAYAYAEEADDAYADDRYAADPDETAGPAGVPGADSAWSSESFDARYAAAPVLEDTRTEVGSWPVQPFRSDPEYRAAERPAGHETATSDDAAGLRLAAAADAAAEAGEDGPGRAARDRLKETRADRAARRWPDAVAPGGDGPAPTNLRYARQPPPLPRRTPRRSPGLTDETPGRVPGWPAQDDRSGHVRLAAPSYAAQPAAPVPSYAAQPAAPVPLDAARSAATAARYTGTAALSESDELFRAWQGSVREAAGPGTRRQAGQAARRRRAWQVAKIGVPAVVIVTVGAGALMMLTGRANEMLAERSSTGTARTGQATSTAAGMILAGYPGARGGVRVAAMWSAAGTIVAVGTADGHPAIWRRAHNGGWPLVSAADLATMSGHLTAVVHGPAGWIAVGSVTSDGMAQPMVYTSADGVTWHIVPSLTALARRDAQFLGVAAGRGGYLVVGREGTGRQKFAQLWWSPDLTNWTAGGNSGYRNSLAIAAAADGGGFVAAGSQADCHTIWTSPDGTHWTTHDVTRPAGARTATLRYAAAGGDGRVVAAGFATNDAGGIPIVVTTEAGGARITQVVLPTGGVPGVVTGVTATGTGFVAAGMIGPANAQRAVTWTSTDGLTWSAATPVSPAAGTAITALASSGGNVTGTMQRGLDPAVLTLPAS